MVSTTSHAGSAPKGCYMFPLRTDKRTTLARVRCSLSRLTSPLQQPEMSWKESKLALHPSSPLRCTQNMHSLEFSRQFCIPYPITHISQAQISDLARLCTPFVPASGVMWRPHPLRSRYSHSILPGLICAGCCNGNCKCRTVPKSASQTVEVVFSNFTEF